MIKNNLIFSWLLATAFFFTTITAAAEQSSTIFLVRHAEKRDAGADPALSDIGKARAQMLAAVLTSVKLTHVYTTNYKRTRDTATPVAQSQGLKIEFYDPVKLQVFAATLLQQKGTNLVVGHSNTTPALAELLSGQPFEKIDEAVYDRVYLFSVYKGSVVSQLVLHVPLPKNY